MIITTCMSSLTTGGPDNEHSAATTNQPGEFGSQRREETPVHNMSCQPSRNPPAGNHLDWEMHTPSGKALNRTKYGHRQDDWPETTQKANPITIKPETASHVAEQLSWVPLPCCSLLERSFPIKSFALSVNASPRTIHFQVLDKSPL